MLYRRRPGDIVGRGGPRGLGQVELQERKNKTKNRKNSHFGRKDGDETQSQQIRAMPWTACTSERVNKLKINLRKEEEEGVC